ncbi:ABC transporter B family member 29, chloroplastic [Rhododendron vialii]|uniref:ABC transporter B family member 29, chloroplastic n=1 Tax=Rhododendron vialii TaxID=182163 RepID=UPI00265F40E7|nr:ABC transporter B family member 29, chloroplastic [Rhododendron vialii]
MALQLLHFTLPSTSSKSLFHCKYKPQSNPRLIITTTTTLKPTLANKTIRSSSTDTAASPSNRSSLDSIKPYVQSQWRPIVAGWACSAVSVFSLSLMVPKIGEFSSAAAAMSPVRVREEAVVLGALAAVRLAASYWQQAFVWDAALNAVCRIRVYVFERVLERDLGFFEGGGGGVSGGDIAYRITAEASDVADTVHALLNTIVPSILQLSAMATQMLVISPVLSLICALVIPLIAFATAYLGERLRKISKDANLSIAALSAYLNEVLPSILFVKANNAEFSEGARFRWLANADLSRQLKKKKMKALVPQIVQIVYFGALLIFCVGSLVVLGGSCDCCGMVSFITSLVFLIEPIQGVGKAYNEFKQGEPAIERLFDLTRFQCKVIETPDAITLDRVTGDVIFCGILFKYRDDMPPVLNGLDLHVKAGETVAIVGPSGGGKTTLVKLLLRLYDPLHGSILIDNHNIQNIRLQSLRRHVGLVSQDVTLYSGTFAENIGYRDLMSQIDMERVKLAARTANADEFIESLPEQYATDIGPRGSILSGGQKQRLAIARAVYQNSSILILDEATSALDSRSEQLVRQAVQRLMEDRTVIVIAHRLETVLMAERVFLLDDGKLRELKHSALLGGKHDTLTSAGIVI